MKNLSKNDQNTVLRCLKMRASTKNSKVRKKRKQGLIREHKRICLKNTQPELTKNKKITTTLLKSRRTKFCSSKL